MGGKGVRNGIFTSKEARRKNEVQKFYKITKSIKAGFQPRTSKCKDKDHNITGQDKV
jgi:hypothetical protein